ncbi:MAG: threonylcarbamoyl-AMP synthase [Candidatus Kapabacteria bacterium]|nr:threonylcarbamoyl-AMP synthase [Candidatus Kapabacteria bacterium]
MILSPTTENLARAADVLRMGGVVAIPTETVYGLAGRIDNDLALGSIFSLKGRPADNPLIVHVSSTLEAMVVVHPSAHEQLVPLAQLFWPGPLTLVLPKADGVSPIVTGGLQTVAVRMPEHPIARMIIELCGSPLAAPSANRSGRPSPTTAEHVESDLGHDVLIVNGGPCRVGLESTVVRVLPDRLVILRPGVVTAQDLQTRSGLLVDHSVSDTELIASPGTRYRHYAPNAILLIVSSEEDVVDHLSGGEGDVMILTRPEVHASFSGRIVGSLTEHDLYAELRRADDLHVERIVVLCDEAVRGNEALMNRLRKASGDGNEQDTGT